MRKIAFLLVALFISQSFSKNIDQTDARRAAISWMKMVPQFSKTIYLPRPEVLTIHNRNQDTTLVYVLQLRPKGYIIVTPVMDLHPILAFSFDSEFDPTESEENHMLLLLRLDMPERLQAVREGRIATNYRGRANELWRQLLQDSGNSLQQVPAQLAWVVDNGPFLTSRWGQGSDAYGNYVFNDYTPNHYVCGCVATAFSQILYYYRWPVTGTDDYSYLWGSTPLSADFGATTYDWANMVDYYGSPAQPEVKRQAAGRLAYHTGVSVDMNYASDGSGAVTARVASALENFFRCNGEWIRGDAADFWDRLYSNMLTGRPAEMGIRTQAPPASGAGHAIVVDGIRHETEGPHYYHLNFGWWGNSDGWYDISGNFSAGGYTWRYKDGAVLDILPLPDLYDPGSTIYTSTFTLSWDDGPVFSPDKYELQQALIGSGLSTFADDAESGMSRWIAQGNWKNVTNAYRSPTHAFKGYIAETSTDAHLFSALELDRALKIDASTQISYYWGAYAFSNCEARFEISTDEKNWLPLRTHTSTETAYPFTWYAVTISPTELNDYAGSTAVVRFIVSLKGTSYSYGSSVGFYFDDLTIQNVGIGNWATVDDNLSGLSKEVTVSQSGDYLFRVRSYQNTQWFNWSDVEAVQVDLPATVTLQVRALLEGPYLSSGSMSTLLRDQSLLPNDSPYAQAPANAPSIPADVTDWLLLQLYESDGATVAVSRSVFIRSDGQLTNENGQTGITLSGVHKTKSYYVVLKHRNHIRVMSSGTVSFASGSAAYDFTDSIDKYYGSNGAKSLPVGFWGLWAGDIDQDGIVSVSDFSAWQTVARAGDANYNTADVRMDGVVTSSDYVYWYENNRAGASTGMPNQ